MWETWYATWDTWYTKWDTTWNTWEVMWDTWDPLDWYALDATWDTSYATWDTLDTVSDTRLVWQTLMHVFKKPIQKIQPDHQKL